MILFFIEAEFHSKTHKTKHEYFLMKKFLGLLKVLSSKISLLADYLLKMKLKSANTTLLSVVFQKLVEMLSLHEKHNKDHFHQSRPHKNENLMTKDLQLAIYMYFHSIVKD